MSVKKLDTEQMFGGGVRKLDNKFKHILPVILLLLLITIIIGVTYAVYTLTTTGNENSITTGLVSMSYTESTNVIDIKNALPMSDAEGKTQDKYFDFSVTSNLKLGENDPDTKVKYSIELETLSYGRVNNIEPKSNNKLDSSVTKLIPNNKTYDVMQVVSDAPLFTFDDSSIKLYLEDLTDNSVIINSKLISNFGTDTVKMLYSTAHNHTYGVNSITTNYRLRAWIDYNVDASYFADNDYEYKFRINVNGDIASLGDNSIPSLLSKNVKTTSISYKYINDANATQEYVLVNNPSETSINNCVSALTSDFGAVGSQLLCSGGTLEGGTLPFYLSLGYIDYNLVKDTGVVLLNQFSSPYNVNDNGLFLYEGTDDNGGEYPIYYYRGNVTNNNVIFANMCWKIVRTTSTGGTKLIYNGVPSEDGKCNNTGTASQLSSTSKFNSSNNSPADVGYMYGTRYTYTSKDMSSVTSSIKYGNDVTYSNGTYTLTGKTMNSTSWSTDRTTIADGYHYTCGNSTGTCTEVYYITYFGDSSYMYYLTFTGGDTLDSAKTKMFTNTNDSTIKSVIDNWYADNLIDYSEFLENTIFCNDRSFASGSMGGALAGKDVNATEFSFFSGGERITNGTPSLICSRNEDKFSLKVHSHRPKSQESTPVLSGINGITGYGNNALDYPTGLLTYDEVMLAGGVLAINNSNYYLYTNQNVWLLSPREWYGDAAHVGCVRGEGRLHSWPAVYSLGVRPVVSLQLGTEFEEGTDGTVNNPYILIYGQFE